MWYDWVLAGVGSLVTLTLARYIYFIIANSEELKIPGPGILPLIGCVLSLPIEMLDRTTHEFVWPKLFKKWSPQQGIFQMYVGNIFTIHTMNPDLIKLVVANPKHNKKPWFYRLIFGRAFGDGLVTSWGDKWKFDRQAITPSFHFDALRYYAEVMNKQSDIMVERFLQTPSGEITEDASNLTNMCAFDVIIETALGVEVHAQTSGDRHYLTDAFNKATIAQNDFFYYNFHPSGREVVTFIQSLNDFTQKIIDERRKALAENPELVQRKSFIDIVLTTEREDGKAFSDQDLMDQVNTFIGAGHDTTGSSTIWCLQLLGHHQTIQQKLYEEIEEVIGNNSVVTLDDLNQMKYLDMVVKEGLRVYPGVPLFARELAHDIEFEGYRIRAGQIVVCQVLTMHRSKEVWGPDADKFDPDRWLPEREKGRNPYAYIPFSAGSRNCVGQKFALQEEKIMLVKILQKVRIESIKDHIPSRMQVVLNPVGGVPLRVFHR